MWLARTCGFGCAPTADDVTPATTIAAVVAAVALTKNARRNRRPDAFITSPRLLASNRLATYPARFRSPPRQPRHGNPFLLSASSRTRWAMRNASVSGLLDRKTLVLAESTSGKGVLETVPDTMMTDAGGSAGYPRRS